MILLQVPTYRGLSLCADGQNCEFPSVRLAIVPGKRMRSLFLNDVLCRISRYVLNLLDYLSYCSLNSCMLHSQILFKNEICIAEAYFYIHIQHEGCEMALALVSLYSEPASTILQHLMNTLWFCKHQGDSAIKFIDVKTIQAIVAMIPHTNVTAAALCYCSAHSSCPCNVGIVGLEQTKHELEPGTDCQRKIEGEVRVLTLGY